MAEQSECRQLMREQDDVVTTDDKPSTADTATLLTGRIEFGDQGVGSMPLDGELALTSAGRASWQSTLSTNALQAAERLWGRRQNARTVSRSR